MSTEIEKKIKLLWVEDETEDGMVERKTCLETTDKYDLHIERNATDAEKLILSQVFDKIIFDIRVPPGFDEHWERLHNKGNNRLGLELINKVFKTIQSNKTLYGICTIERWVDIQSSILSTDPDFKMINRFKLKDDIIFPEDFEDFIQNIN